MIQPMSLRERIVIHFGMRAFEDGEWMEEAIFFIQEALQQTWKHGGEFEENLARLREEPIRIAPPPQPSRSPYAVREEEDLEC